MISDAELDRMNDVDAIAAAVDRMEAYRATLGSLFDPRGTAFSLADFDLLIERLRFTRNTVKIRRVNLSTAEGWDELRRASERGDAAAAEGMSRG